MTFPRLMCWRKRWCVLNLMTHSEEEEREEENLVVLQYSENW